MPRKQNLNPTLATCPTPSCASQSRMERSHCRPGGSQSLHIDMRNRCDMFTNCPVFWVCSLWNNVLLVPWKENWCFFRCGTWWNGHEQPTNQQLLYSFLTVLTNTHLPSSAQWHTPASGTSTANWYMKWSTADKTLQTGHVIARPTGCENNLANTRCGLASWPYTFVNTEYIASCSLTILIE